MKPGVLTLVALLALPALAGADPQERTRTTRTERVSTPHVVLYQRGAQSQTEQTSHTLKVGSSGEIDISNLAGNITVQAGKGGEARLDVLKTARGATAEDAREFLKLVTVDIMGRGARAEIRTRYPDRPRNDRRPFSVSVAYTLTAPPDTKLTLRTMSGNIRVSDIKGDLMLDATSGNVEIVNAARIMLAKSVSGNVTITGARSEGTLEASSLSGNVTLRDVEARRLSLNSISGNVVLENVSCTRADAQTMSGHVFFNGQMARDGRYDFKSHSGDVRIQVDGSVGFALDASSFSGTIRSDLPLTTTAGAARGGPIRRSFRGTFGDGSAVVNAVTFSGNVVVGKR